MQDFAGAVIAAAGLGSRLGMGMPKCMIEVNGRTILSRLIDTLSPHVPIISIVAGYREEMVIDYCAKHHPDVVITRNQDFRNTNTAYSFHMGASIMHGKVLYLDGDIIVTPESLGDFIHQARASRLLVGVTEAKSKDPVFAHISEVSGKNMISGFSRTEPSKCEWANVFSAPSDVLQGASGFVYERLNALLPANYAFLNLHEVDTVEDLEMARLFASKLDSITDRSMGK